MTDAPSPNAGNGRGAGGRFAKGNGGGPGNPHARRVAELRSAMLNAVTPQDVRDVMAALLAAAKGGDVAAARELLQRLLGPPVELDFVERLAALEEQLAQAGGRGGAW
jgi:hypothetical protein